MAAAPQRYNERIFGELDGGGNQSLILAPAGIEFSEFGLPELGHVPPTRLAMNVQHTAYKGFIAPVVLYVVAAVAIFRSTRAEKKAEREKGEKP
jgi:fumarate reductase subunit D